jgi:hypothetical protein
MKMTSFWDMEPCGFVEINGRFEGRTASKTSAFFNETARHRIPHGCYLQFLNIVEGENHRSLQTE